jgi:hypothetical protein
MAQDHRLQQQRFELKYLIREEMTGPMRDFISAYLEPDDFAVEQPSLSYPVHSIYIDSDDLKTHQAVVAGHKNRFKLRLRYYDDNPDTPVFFEIKARVDNCIMKQRCGVRRNAVPLLLAGQLPEPGQLISHEPRHLATLERFNFLQTQLDAVPRLHNCYHREAWVSANDNSTRITFDRNIFAEPWFSDQPVIELQNPVQIYPDFVVFEIKFATRFPNWCRDLVRSFNLMQFSAAKYSGGIETLGHHRLLTGDQTFVWQRPAKVQPTVKQPNPPLQAVI